MKYFTKSQVEELRKQLATLGVRDSELEEATSLTGDELVAIVQRGQNKTVNIKDLFSEYISTEIIEHILRGKSAYEIAIENGFEGTEQEWLDSLKADAVPIDVVNNLTEGGTTKALSAEMGKYLKQLIDENPGGGSDIDIVNDLVTGGSDRALSAQMGVCLRGMIEDIPVTEIVDNLETGGSTKALSAEQGKQLKMLIDAIVSGETSDYEGAFKSLVFLRSNTTPDTPTGGTYLTPVPSGWSDGIPSGEEILWMSTRWFYLDSERTAATSWSTPQKMTDTSVLDLEFSSVATNPGNPTDNPNNWHNDGLAGDIWMASRVKTNGIWGNWSIVKIKGESGDTPNATFKSFVFLKSLTQPTTPGNGTNPSASNYGGSYENPIPAGGWSDGIPSSGSGIIWMSSRTFSSDGNHGNWSTPIPVADNQYMDYEFSSVENPGQPSKSAPSSASSGNWSNTATENTIWMAMREVLNGAYKDGSTWQLVRIKGEKGQDGTSISIKGSKSTVSELPSTGNTIGDAYLVNGDLYIWDGDTWENAGQLQGPAGANGQTPYIHIKYSNDGGNSFTYSGSVQDGETPGDYIGLYWDYTPTDSSTPSDYTWKKWVGEDGFGYEYVFKLTSDPTAPALPSTSPNVDDYEPTAEGWTDDAAGVSSNYPYCWVAWRKKTDGVWSSWQGNNGYARLFSHWGTNGNDGATKFKSLVFRRGAGPYSAPVVNDSITDPTNPSFTGSFGNPVPYGWSDGIPSGSGLLWMMTRIFSSDGSHQNIWTNPQLVGDTEYMDYEWSIVENPGLPAKTSPSASETNTNWIDEPGNISDPSQIIWMAQRPIVNGAYETGSSWLVMKIRGEGTNGYNVAKVFLYKRAASSPSIDWSNELVYSFPNRALTTTPSGWSQTPPVDTSGTGNPVYVTVATASSRTDTDTIAANEWAEPVVFTGSGLNTASIMLYQRAATQPTVPSVTTTYTFSTGFLSGSITPWSRTVPTTNGLPCWVTQATAISTGLSDTIQSSEWSTPQELVEDGTSALIVVPERSSVAVPSSSNGIVTSPLSVAIKCRLYRGDTEVVGATWSMSAASSITCQFNYNTGSLPFVGYKPYINDDDVQLYYKWGDDSPIVYTENRFPNVGDYVWSDDDSINGTVSSVTRGISALSIDSNGGLHGTISSMSLDSVPVLVTGTDPVTGASASVQIEFFKTKMGSQGLSGKIMRGVTEFSSTPDVAYEGAEDTVTGHLYFDVVSHYNSTTTTYDLYYCKVYQYNGQAASYYEPGVTTGWENVWVLATNFKFVATDVLLAQNAKVGPYSLNSSGLAYDASIAGVLWSTQYGLYGFHIQKGTSSKSQLIQAWPDHPTNGYLFSIEETSYDSGTTKALRVSGGADFIGDLNKNNKPVPSIYRVTNDEYIALASEESGEPFDQNAIYVITDSNPTAVYLGDIQLA